MWFFRELARLVIRIGIASAIAVGLAGVLALVASSDFSSNARLFCIVIGCMLLAMAGVGSNSNLNRYMDQNVTKTMWGTIPGFDALKRNPEDPTLAPGVVFFCSGLVVLILGIAVF